jgi:hypothetical protein
MNARRAVSENCVKLAATNASASEQMASTTARPASASTPIAPWPATPSRIERGTNVCNDAAVAAPMTRKPPAWRKSCWAVSTNVPKRDGSSRSLCLALATHSSRPLTIHTKPTTHAAKRLATNRASTTFGCPGKATAVATRTTGFTAGADRRNVTAAAGATPRATSRPAIGTEPHSQPGSATPATAATGTANPARSGNARASAAAGTYAAMAPLTATPNTRNGSACTQMATKMVVQLWSASPSTQSATNGRATTAPTTSATSTGRARARLERGGASVVSAAGNAGTHRP